MDKYYTADSINSNLSSSSWTSTSATSIYNSSTHPITNNLIKIENDIKDIKKTLLILERDIDMEYKYQELKKAYEAYNEVLKKLKIYEALTNDTEGDA